MDDQYLIDLLAPLDELPLLDRDHLFDRLIQAHGLLSEVADHLVRSSEYPELLGMVKSIERLSDYILINFQQIVLNDASDTI